MAKKRTFKDYTQGASPAGTFVFPKLSEPDFKFQKEFGEYSVSLDLTGEDAESFKKIIDAAVDTEYPFECEKEDKELDRGNLPYEQATDKDKEDIPGVTRFKFKRKAGGRYGKGHDKAGETWSAKIRLLDAAATRVVEEPIWGGTVGRVSFVLVPWVFQDSTGVRLQLDGAQILDLITKGERSAESLGFSAEDGYSAPDDATGQDVPDGDDADTGADDELGEEAGGVEF